MSERVLPPRPGAATPTPTRFGDAEFTKETARLLFDFSRFVGGGVWKYWRMRRRARRAVVFAPLGVRVAQHLLTRQSRVVYRTRIEPGSRLQISMADPVRRKRAQRSR